MSSIRVCTRKDGSSYTQILFREFDPAKGRKVQASVAFDEHASALRWRRILDDVGPEQFRALLSVEQAAAEEKTTTVADWVDTYVAGKTGIEPGTLKRYRSYADRDIAPALGDLPLTALCVDSAAGNSPVQEWIQDLENDSVAPKTIANKHGFLSGALKVAVRRRLIPFNPCEDTRLPRRRYEPCFLEPDEFDLLLSTVSAQWRPMVLFLVTTGARYSEATALRANDLSRGIDEAGQPYWTCRISRAWKYTGTQEQRLGVPKTTRGVRTINVPVQTVESLGIEVRRRDSLLFRTLDGGRISNQQFNRRCWKPAVDLLEPKFGKRPRVHDLRHTCASWMINNGAELADVSAHLGHESIQTTVDVYGHLDRRSGARASTAVSKALARPAV